MNLMWLLTFLTFFGFRSDADESKSNSNEWRLDNGFIVEACECQFARPDRFRDENFGIKYPAFRPYGEKFEVTGVFKIQGHWGDEAERSHRKVKIPIEFEFVPLGLDTSPELSETLRAEKKFPWDRWGLDDRIEAERDSETKENSKERDAQANGKQLEPKIVRFVPPKDKDFFGSPRTIRGGYRTVKYELEIELPANGKVHEEFPFQFIYDQQKPPVACCFYRIGVKSPEQVLTTRAGVFYHGSKFDQQEDALEAVGKGLLEKLELPRDKAIEDKE